MKKIYFLTLLFLIPLVSATECHDYSYTYDEEGCDVTAHVEICGDIHTTRGSQFTDGDYITWSCNSGSRLYVDAPIESCTSSGCSGTERPSPYREYLVEGKTRYRASCWHYAIHDGCWAWSAHDLYWDLTYFEDDPYEDPTPSPEDRSLIYRIFEWVSNLLSRLGFGSFASEQSSVGGGGK